jgi:hypothetical protein
MKPKISLKILIKLDEHTHFYFGNKNGFNNSIFVKFDGIREPENGHKGNQKIEIYTREDLINYYSVDRGEFKLDETKKFVIDNKRELIFIPLLNKDGNIVDYGITCLKYYDELRGSSFTRLKRQKRKYLGRSSDRKNLHEIIFGRKAKVGGWEKVENYVETEETKSSIWLQSIEMPLPHIGKKWNFCKDEQGNIYIKYPGYVIDHRNSDTLDNRIINLREIPFGANSANKSKVRGSRSSDYFGVLWSGGKWVGKIKFKGENYQRRFDNEIDAAIFRDMYALVLYQIVLCNNGLLTNEQIEDILNRKEEAIPENFRAIKKKKRDLPKHVMRDGEGYRLKQEYNGKSYFKRYKTLEETISGIPLLNLEIEKLKDENEKRRVDSKRINTDEKYGILESRGADGKINSIAKVDKVIWEKYSKMTWNMSSYKRLRREINGFLDDLHIHVFREYFEDYHRTVHGTIDHIIQDKIIDGINYSDCSIENLRCATFSQQTQNRNVKRTLPYTGIVISNGKFFAVFNWKGEKSKYGKRRLYAEDAAKDYNDFALEKWAGAKLNIIDDVKTKTTVEDLFHKSKLTLEKIENFATIKEIITTLYVNEDWAIECEISNFSNIRRSSFEKYHAMIKKLFLKEEIENFDEDDESDEEINEDQEEINEDELEDENFENDNENVDEYDDEYEDEKPFEIVITENLKYVEPKPYVKKEGDKETDASKIGNWIYGYDKGFDRSKIIIKEDEAQIIRFIFKEKDSGTIAQKVTDKLNEMEYKKEGKPWALRSVRTIHEHRKKYEGELINGFRLPKIIEK